MSDTFVAPPRTFANFDPKAVLPGFEHIRRFWDPAQEVVTVKILPGEYYVSRQEEMISTVLGSCVSACVRDTRLRIGGMNHFMLPEPAGERDSWSSAVGRAARYGNDAMEQLINAILKAGGRRDDFEVKIFGLGGQIEKFGMGEVEKGTDASARFFNQHGNQHAADKPAS